jgi:predicted pyridoxine 5'-phosphate oxidase superfamily flavin-nucleotide-binding protein
MQERVGVRERMEEVGHHILRDFMPDQHRAMFSALPWMVVGGLDPAGHPRATALVGGRGFVSSPDPGTLRVGALPGAGDPLADCLRAGAPVGLLGIELATRRRNRMNGRVAAIDGRGFTVEVGQSFGNCKQYIQARDLAEAAPAGQGRRVRDEAALGPATRALIERADTFFIATASRRAAEDAGDPSQGIDVSHRGGRPGFVRIGRASDGAETLTWPDFPGNRLFNTLGNLAEEPRAALLFVDFTAGDLVEVRGRGQVIWGGPRLEAFDGAERLVELSVEAARTIEGAFRLTGSAPRPAPEVASTGSWEEVDARLSGRR